MPIPLGFLMSMLSTAAGASQANASGLQPTGGAPNNLQNVVPTQQIVPQSPPGQGQGALGGGGQDINELLRQILGNQGGI